MDALIFDTAAILNFGHRGDLAHILTHLAGCHRLLTTPGVIDELTDPDRHVFYQRFVAEWFIVQKPADSAFDLAALVRLSSTIDPGELSVLSLAKELSATAVLDDRAARREALRLGIRITGTVGLMYQAVIEKWMTEPECLARISKLCDNGFAIPRPVPAQTLLQYLETLGRINR